MRIPNSLSVVLDEVSAELLNGANICHPPVDVLQLADRQQIVVALDYSLQVRGRYKNLRGQPTILLKPDERPERIQWAAAHELGEVVAWRVFERLCMLDDDVLPPMREQVANLLASRLLLPTRWFFEDVARWQGDILRLKPIYRTASHELIAYRLLDAPERTIISVFDQGRLTRRRDNALQSAPGLQPVEHDCWNEVCRSHRPVEMQERDFRVQGWPIYEAGWRREILRTTFNDDGTAETPNCSEWG